MIKIYKISLFTFAIPIFIGLLLFSCSEEEAIEEINNPNTLDLNSILSSTNGIAYGMASNHKFIYFIFDKGIYSIEHKYFGTSTPELVFANITVDPAELLVNNNTLYISDLGVGQQILTLDLTNCNTTLQTLVSGLASQIGLAVYQNHLYFSEW